MEREIKANVELHTNIKISMIVECMRLESFDLKVGPHQELVRSVRFCLRWFEVTKDFREGIIKEFLYADDMVLIEDS